MDLRLNDADLNKLDELFDIDECNKVFADFLLDYIKKNNIKNEIEKNKEGNRTLPFVLLFKPDRLIRLQNLANLFVVVKDNFAVGGNAIGHFAFGIRISANDVDFLVSERAGINACVVFVKQKTEFAVLKASVTCA